MATEPTTDELTAGLRSYGRWLEERSHVALADPDRRDALDRAAAEADRSTAAEPTALPLTGRHWDRPWLAPTRSRVVAWSGAGLLAIGALVIGLAVVDRPESDLVTADQASSDESGLAITTADGERSVLRVDGEEAGEAAVADGSEAAPDPSTPPAAGSTSEPGTGVAGSTDDERSDPTSSPAEADGSDGDDPSWLGSGDETGSGGSDDPAGGGSGGDTVAGSGVVRFVSPTQGETIQLNLANEFRATAVDGADRYHFVGSQDGVEVLNLSVAEPYFVLPSQMLGGPSMEAGLLDLTVTATAGDRVLAASTISIRVDATPGRPTWGR